MKRILLLSISLFLFCFSDDVFSQNQFIDDCNVVWDSQSLNAGSSMPVGGGDIGCNVWVEKNDLLLYFSKSGSFDENNTFLKGGRLRLRFAPNLFNNVSFKQELILRDGYINLSSSDKAFHINIKVWVDVFDPVIHIDMNANKPVQAEAIYENWRFVDRRQTGKANNGNSWKWATHVPVIAKTDSICFYNDNIIFYHRNTEPTVFDAAVLQQGLDTVKDKIFDPLKNLTSGGLIKGDNFIKSNIGDGVYANTPYKSFSLVSRTSDKHHSIEIYLCNAQVSNIISWKTNLENLIKTYKSNQQKSIDWWRSFWQRCFIYINPFNKTETDTAWQVGRNYQLFRYMLGCNAYGQYPTKFNGGLFTVDPVFTDTSINSTPDFRNWGGGTFTAQNQRLVYWPMIKSGDVEMMKPQFDFYNRLLATAKLRTKIYWGHEGAHFNEQIEDFGLPNPTEYGWKRPVEFDPGLEYNAWLEYEWDTVLEFCMMILQTHVYDENDISEYLPLIKNCLIFFDKHYQWLAKKRGIQPLDENGHLILYPGSAAETFKLAYNSSSTIAGLKTVTETLLEMSDEYLTNEEKSYFEDFEKRLPPIPFTVYNGHVAIAPAKVWARVNNVESPQLYPVFPWGIFGVGKSGLDTARNTYQYDTFAIKFRSAVGWKQDNIFAARLGLTSEAKKLTTQKLQNSGRRFPAFWGPGFDWVPDHNWGGSGMIGLQEMLLQAVDDKIYLFPAWPKQWDVVFKLHAPHKTTVQATLRKGRIVSLTVTPKEREKDIVNMLQ